MAATPSAERLDQRSTLWLVAALALVTLPHLERVPTWLAAVAIALTAWRLLLVYFGLRLPSRWLLVAIALAAAGGVYLSYGRLLGRDPGVALLVVMLALKLLELASHREGMVLTFLAYFLVITNFLYSQTIPVAIYMLFAVWFITATMTGLQYRQARPAPRVQLRAAGILLAQAAPLALVLFLLFPRVSGPLWGLPQDSLAGMTGLSDRMSPGTLSTLILSDEVAFRAKFETQVPAAPALYWRGPVLWDFDGTTWTAPRVVSVTPHTVTALSEEINYSVTVEPNGKRWLFALDLPRKTPPRAVLTADFQLLWPGPLTGRVRYDMSSALDYRAATDETANALQRNRQLPAGTNPRTVAFARELKARVADERGFVAAVMDHLRAENFTYTLSPPLLTSANPVDQFMFEARAGFCEHYASAFAVMARAAGIPARVVTGYQGGELNTVGEYLIVRQADAHAWVEIWLPSEGWIRVDPTAAVSPARLQTGIETAGAGGAVLPGLAYGRYPWLHRARLTWDSVANSWNQLVLGYGLDRQQQLLNRIGINEATWQTLTTVMLVAVGLVTALLAAVSLHRLRRPPVEPVQRQWDKFCARLAALQLRRAPHEGPLDYARRASAQLPHATARIEAIARLYAQLRYGRAASTGEVAKLRALVDDFRPRANPVR